MKTPTPLPSALLLEDQVIRQLLSGKQAMLTQAFTPELERRFWQSLADRSIGMIRNAHLSVMLGYIGLGMITLPTVYLISEAGHRLHDVLIWLYAYANGAICLSLLLPVAYMAKLSRHYQNIILALTFWAVLATSFLMLQFQTPLLAQQASYIVVFIYMFSYFLSGVPPQRTLIACAVASGLSFAMLFMLDVQINFLMFFYAVVFSNAVGFMLAHLMIGKDRISFLQARLLEIDQIKGRAMSQEFARLSREDPVTGLANRRFFNEVLTQEWELARHSNEPLSLVFVDVDHFKAFNDTYGHLEGDDALVKIAYVLKRYLRRSADLAARYGGEEFILLLPNTHAEGALQVANKMMLAIDQLQIPHASSASAAYITASFGVATWYPARQNMTIDQLIHQADSAVYQAKSLGRHRVRAFGVE
ncbi:MAG: GGDEF domain-containing protein [Pseudomonadota bacterium]|nr:GGDEF domain-containing protein [Pseudomonadota bacterium]